MTSCAHVISTTLRAGIHVFWLLSFLLQLLSLVSFVSCRLDRIAVRRSNSAAAVSTEHGGTLVLRQLHWLPVKQRIDFKLAVLVYKSLHGLAPPYLLDVGRRHLRSFDVYTCVVPRRQSEIGNRSFSVAGPWLWNNLPTEIRRRGTTFEYYRRLLKVLLFVYAAAHRDFYLTVPDISTLTHSLTHSGVLGICV